MREKEAESSKTAGGQRRGAGKKQREEIQVERGGTESRKPNLIDTGKKSQHVTV